MVSASILALVFTSDVVSAQRIRDVEKASVDTRIVYGSFDLFEMGEPETKRHGTLVILPSDANRALTYRVSDSENGVFYWELDPGDYIVIGYLWGEGRQIRRAYIQRNLSVPRSGGDIYIGTIEAHVDEINLQMQVHDQFDQISRIYDTKFPARQGTSQNLVLADPQPIGNFVSIAYQCNLDWGIECDDRFQGVTPVTPTVSEYPGIWPKVENLTPEFSWVPSTSAGVTYDVIVYEAANLRGPVFMRGRVIAYEEALVEPNWRPQTPLQHDSRYYWSVRLRRGDIVSGWTTQGFALFAIVTYASGSGQWFQLRTP